ncbi:MAG: DUF3352 domain-containing protein [Bacteroidota bacterium]
MTKKILITVSIVLILGLVAGGYLLLRQYALKDTPSLKAVPANASMIFQTKDLGHFLKKLNEKSLIFDEFSKTKELEHLHAGAGYLSSVIDSSSMIRSVLKNNLVTVSFHISGRDKLPALLIIPVNRISHKNNIPRAIAGLTNEPLTTRRYENVKVYDGSFTTTGTAKSFSFCLHDNLFLFSLSSLLIEDGIRTLKKGGSINGHQGFQEIASTAGQNVDGNLFVNFKNAGNFIKTLANNAHAKYVENVKNLTDWCAYDITLREKELLMNGFASTPGDKNYLSLFRNTGPSEIQVYDILPASTAVLQVTSVPDFKRYMQNFTELLSARGTLKAYQNKLNELENTFNFNLDKDFIPLVDQEFGIFQTTFPGLSREENRFVFFRVKSAGLTKDNMLDMLSGYFKKNNIEKSRLEKIYRVDNETEIPVYSFPVQNFAGLLPGDMYRDYKTSWFGITGNYLVFGSSYKGLTKILQTNMLGKTLARDMDFINTTELLTRKTNFLFYYNASLLPGYLAETGNEAITNFLRENKIHVQKIRSVGYQLNGGNKLIFNNAFITFSPVVKEETHTVWETLLDTVIDFKPALVTNHNTGDKEIFVQDLNHNIYLINSAGRILWKNRMDERINSEIFQTDYYKNNKLQYLFSTPNHIHLIDRNGNFVERYPIKVRATLTKGISVFDYDKNLDYRIFCVGNDQKVYAYDIEGNIVPGWEFNKTDNQVVTPVNHFRLGTLDFIVFADQYRIYILNRKGEIRIPVNKTINVSHKNNFILDKENEKPRLVITDETGNVHFIYFDGTLSETEIKNYTSNHFFDFQDVNGDGKRDYIFLDQNNLEVYNEDKSKIFSARHENNLHQPPDFYVFSSSDRKIGIVEKKAGKIFLYNNDGSIYDDFPLPGVSRFSIGIFNSTESRFNLIAGGKNNFLFNYSVK